MGKTFLENYKRLIEREHVNLANQISRTTPTIF